jgi:hypothetical protein
MSGKSTRKAKASADAPRSEYRRSDLGKGVRGKYYKQFREGSNVVLLEPDVARAFPTGAAVNKALRSLIEIASRTKP